MKPYKTALLTTALVATVGLTGCKEKILEGTVMEEFGTANMAAEQNKTSLADDSILFKDINYGFTLKAQDGIYIVNVVEYRRKLLIDLARKIEEGDKVRVINFDGLSCSDGYIEKSSKGKIGAVRSNAVNVIEKAKK
jgi:hypothetical protein